MQDAKSFTDIKININQDSTLATSHPNIIIILADDLGYGDISAYNENSGFKTPNIDKLINQGVQFNSGYTTSSVCTPTRYGILTGRYNWRSELKQGVLTGYSKPLINNERLTIAEMLKQKNYMTAFIGKWHLGWDWDFVGEPKSINNYNNQPEVDFSQPIKNGPEDHGFLYSYGIPASMDMPPFVYVENSQPTSIPNDTTVNYERKVVWHKGPKGSDFNHIDVFPHLNDKSVKYIDQQADSDKPFFLYYALPAPHAPFLPTDEFVGQSNTNIYGDFMLQVDYALGQITEELEKNNVLDETIVIFTSDNGATPLVNFDELAQAGHDPSYIYRGHKADIYEGGLRVPFIVSWPGKIQEGFESNITISTVDFMATIADIIGFSLPDTAAEDSYSFLPILLQENYNKPIREATVLHSYDGRFAIIKDKWKLILWPGSGGWSYPRNKEEIEGLPYFQLYNLKEDPSEKVNLVHLYPEKVKELKSLLEKYIDEGRSTPGVPQKNDGKERWSQLEWMNL